MSIILVNWKGIKPNNLNGEDSNTWFFAVSLCTCVQQNQVLSATKLSDLGMSLGMNLSSLNKLNKILVKTTLSKYLVRVILKYTRPVII